MSFSQSLGLIKATLNPVDWLSRIAQNNCLLLIISVCFGLVLRKRAYTREIRCTSLRAWTRVMNWNAKQMGLMQELY